MNEKIVITSAACTPMGGFQSVLAPVSAPELGAAAIGAAVERDGISADAVDEVIMGWVLSAGLGQTPTRQTGLGAGLSSAMK